MDHHKILPMEISIASILLFQATARENLIFEAWPFESFSVRHFLWNIRYLLCQAFSIEMYSVWNYP